MKKIYACLTLMMIQFSVCGQVINIPDANFKNYLLTGLTADTDGDGVADAIADVNNDGEIDQTEALAITQLYMGNANIASLAGIEYFTNLINLDFDNNQVTSVDFHTLHHLKRVQCDNNLLTAINLCGTAVTSLWVGENPDLSFISVKNNVISSHDLSRPASDATPPPLMSFMFGNLPALQTVCYDEGELAALDFLLSWPNITLTTDCVSNCNEIPNIITGNVRFDYNNNGCDASDLGGGMPIKATRDGQVIFTTYSGSNGFYRAYTFDDSITLTPQLTNPYFTVNPATANTTFSGTGNAENIDFCITPNGTFPDLSIDFATGTSARPGFDAIYFLYYKNKGTIPLSGQVSVNFDHLRLDYLGSNPASATHSNGTITWNFDAIAPFETRYIAVTMHLHSPASVPPVNVGDVLDFSATITPATVTDTTPEDNSASLTQIVRGAFDPNDLTVSRLQSHIEPSMESLTYTIRFQNTGNEPAQKIVVSDWLDPRFDKSSLEIVGASHGFRSSFFPDNKLEFTFDDINLPPSATDLLGSQGYVTFKIKPTVGSLVHGDTITNEANIYFDFNLPVLTNSVTTSYTALAKGNFHREATVNLYPNPVKNTLNFNVPEQMVLRNVSIYNTLGQLVQSVPLQTATTISVNVAQLKTGTYFIEIFSDQGKTTKKFIKL